MRTLLLSALCALVSLPALAYDDGWYRAEYWSGEYPNGFSVIAPNVQIPVRPEMNASLPTTANCAVPFKANFHPWNSARPATYVTMSKIARLTVKEDFTFQDDDRQVDLKQGEVIEYLIYGSEGWFLVRIRGEEYVASQSLFDHVEVPADGALQQDEWMHFRCESGQEAWALLADLTHFNEEGESVYFPGLDSWFLGFVEYGQARDLTDEDLPRKLLP